MIKYLEVKNKYFDGYKPFLLIRDTYIYVGDVTRQEILNTQESGMI